MVTSVSGNEAIGAERGLGDLCGRWCGAVSHAIGRLHEAGKVLNQNRTRLALAAGGGDDAASAVGDTDPAAFTARRKRCPITHNAICMPTRKHSEAPEQIRQRFI